MAKDSDRLRRGFEVEETGGALSGLLAEEDEFDRRTLWRLGTWAAVSVGAVVVALVTNQSSIGMRREQTAAADLMRQTQQAQLTAKDSQNEARRLASAVETLNSDRDRLYSRVAVLEQELDSVTGAIARQAPTAPSSQAGMGPASASQASPSQTGPSQSSPSQASSSSQAGASQTAPSAVSSASPSASSSLPASSAAPVSTSSTASAATASVDPQPPAAKPAPAAPVVAPVAATGPAIAEKQDKVGEKQDKQASPASPSDPSPAAKSAAAQPQPGPAQPSGSLMAPKSMMAPPDPAAGKLIEPAAPPRAVTAAPLPEIAAITPKVAEEAEPDSTPEALELVARRTEFGVDVGGANSVPGLRALWHGLLKSRTNAALTTLRPIIVIKENNNGLGMQLRLVAGPINDAAAAAKICASLTVNDRGCTTTVFEGQRLTMGGEEQAKADARTVSEVKPTSDAKADSAPKGYSHRHHSGRYSPKEDETPKSEPSTLSLIFGKH